MKGNGATALPYGNLYIQAGLLYPFLNNLAVYRCPADQSIWPYPGKTDPDVEVAVSRVRSVSMNCWLNPIKNSWNVVENYGAGKAQKVFRKYSTLGPAPGPAGTWVFVDENPATIDSGFFVCDNALDAWVNVPASFHAGAGGVAFADGRALMRKWSDPQVLGFNNYNPASPAIALGGGNDRTDLAWLQKGSSVLLP
jgi:hypothetical protein